MTTPAIPATPFPASPSPQHAALVRAGRAMDRAMMKLTTHDRIDLFTDAPLVDELHQALNGVVAIIGAPWRNPQ